MKTKKFNLKKAKAGAKIVNRMGSKVLLVHFQMDQNLAIHYFGETDDIDEAIWHDDSGLNPDGEDDYDLFLLEEPVYKPFNSSNFPLGKIVKGKNSKNRYFITSAEETYVVCGNYNWEYAELLENFVFENGEPVGEEV